MKKIMVILRKEWLELRQQRSLVAMTIFLPLLLTLMPSGIVFIMGRVPEDQLDDFSNTEQFTAQILAADPTLVGLNTRELAQVITGRQFSMFFLLIPLFIPSTIAAYSIIGEKTKRTLEPVLATPIRTWELLLAKCLTGLIPALIVTYFCGLVFIGAIYTSAASARAAQLIVTPGWLILWTLCAPLLTLISIALTIVISSRVNDPRTAQQASGVIVVPIIALIVAQITGVLVLNTIVAAITVLILALLAGVSLWFAVKLFQREAILTRWSS
jgi:ABC-2 type transport system permease protein